MRTERFTPPDPDTPMSADAPLLVYVTTPDRDTADALARLAVGERLAACANRIGPVGSIYRWDGDVVVDEEVSLILKTTRDRFDALRDAIVDAHPYDCPCVVALPIVDGHGPWLQWLRDETRDG